MTLKPPPRKKRPGKWVCLANDFHQNPKILTLLHHKRHKAVVVYVAALSWCGEHMSDGFVPNYALHQVHGTAIEAAQLCDVGLWATTENGWRIHDWDDWQDTNPERKARTEYHSGLANLRHHGHPDGPTNLVPLPSPDARRNA